MSRGLANGRYDAEPRGPVTEAEMTDIGARKSLSRATPEWPRSAPHLPFLIPFEIGSVGWKRDIPDLPQA